MLSPEGRCKTLDASADGYLRAEGCGALMLRPWWLFPGPSLGAGSATGSRSVSPLALLSGAAVNQDGRSSSLTAPNGPAQQAVTRGALASFGNGMGAHQVRGARLGVHGSCDHSIA